MNICKPPHTMLTPEKIEELRAQAHEAIAQEIYDDKQPHISDLSWILQQLPAWKRWWLKRNQQRNYFRVIRLIPPGGEETPYFWRYKFQVWVNCKLENEHHITQEAFEFFYNNQTGGWEIILEPGIAKAILRPPAPKTF